MKIVFKIRNYFLHSFYRENGNIIKGRNYLESVVTPNFMVLCLFTDRYIRCILSGFRNRLWLVDYDTLPVATWSGIYCAWETI